MYPNEQSYMPNDSMNVEKHIKSVPNVSGFGKERLWAYANHIGL
jgi:hypothetical protein